MKIKKGDKVKVITGKDKGKSGEVLRAFPQTGKVLVDGVAIAKRSIRGTQGQTGRVVERAMPIDASNVMLIDPETKSITRVGYRVEDGKRVRIAKASNHVLK